MSNDKKIIRPVHWEKLRSDEAERLIKERANVTAKSRSATMHSIGWMNAPSPNPMSTASYELAM